jgi:hypothetical protein
MNRYNQGLWSVNFPDKWTVQDDKSPVTFFDDGADWAVQISNYLKESEPVTDADLQEVMSDLEKPGCAKEKITTPHARGLKVEFTNLENILWRHILLRSGRIMLYITYNANKDGRQLDESTLQQFIESVEITGEQVHQPDAE